jgi:hypothetical protein
MSRRRAMIFSPKFSSTSACNPSYLCDTSTKSPLVAVWKGQPFQTAPVS